MQDGFGDNGREFVGWGDGTVSNELFVAAIESCPVGITISDATKPSQPLIYVNSAFAGITGYFPHEVAGHDLSFLHGPNTDPETVTHIRTTLERHEPVDADILLYRRNRNPFWCDLRMTPLTHDVRTVALIGVHTDITEKRRRQIEDQRQQNLQALGQLAGGVAHELNNLLQPILSFGDLALDELAGREPGVGRRLSRMIDSAEKARDIVRGILRFARGEAEPMTVLELRPALAEAIEFVTGLMPRGVTICVVGLERNLGRARINTVELTQILTNLLTNATQAMNGQGTIVIRAKMIGIDARRAGPLGMSPGNACQVTVADDGPGMDDTVQAHLFDPFFTTKPIGQGTGLGLSVIYGILQSWQGAISVISAPGAGAQFTFLIPCVESTDG